MGSQIAQTEGCPTVPGTPTDHARLLRDLTVLCQQLGVVELLRGWTASARYIQEGVIERAHYYVIELDTDERDITVTGFERNQLGDAQAYRAAREIETIKQAEIDVVLIAADQIDQVRRAYPNYHLDTGMFLSELERAIE